MDQIQIIKQLDTEQPVYHLKLENNSPVNYSYQQFNQQNHPIKIYEYKSSPIFENQQPQLKNQQIINHQSPIIQQQILQTNSYDRQHATNQPKQLQNVVQVHFQDEKPMMLNAWTQTNNEEFSSRSNNKNEAELLARIKDLEARLKSQNDLISITKNQEKTLRTPPPSNELPNSTTSTPKPSIPQNGTRYRINGQPNEANNDSQLEIELSDETKSLSSSSNSADSDRLEICLNDEPESNPERPDLENATVSIGPNGTRIPVHDYEKMSWSSPSLVTRKLLSLVFDRETLATHSMTGKASPAFKDLNKPIKGRLDPEAVQDIIFIASVKCGVPAKEIRAAITTKCADENKMCKLKALKRIEAQNSRRSALKDINRNKSNSGTKVKYLK